MTAYFVDPSAGADTNSGLTQALAWKTIPGTRTTTNSAFLRTSWGSISTASKLQPGDTIDIKAGTTMNNTIGGRLLIDMNFYNNGTASSPITIRVSSTWGTGHFTYNMSGITPATDFGLIHISARNYIALKGVSATRRFVMLNANGYGLMTYGTSGTHQQGVVFDFMEVYNATIIGINCSFSDNWTVSNCLSHDNGQIGFTVGGLSDQVCVGGQYVDCEAATNGASGGASGIQHGFGLYGSTSITYRRCVARNNLRDGFDSGTTSNVANSGATFIDCQSYSNGEDGYGCNAGPNENGFFTYINCNAWNNSQAGWNIYAGAQASLYHCLAHYNGNQSAYGGNFMINSEFVGGSAALTSATLRNCIGYKPRAYANVYSYNSGGLATTISSNYCIWVPRSSNTEVFAETPFGTTFTYTSPPSWSGAQDKRGIAFDPGFIAISTTTYATNDYHLSSSSSLAANIGLFLNNTPTGVGTDRGGSARANPPDIGLYEYAPGGGGSLLSAPTNFRFT